MLKHREKDIS